MKPREIEDDWEATATKEIFVHLILPWLLLAVLAILWFLV